MIPYNETSCGLPSRGIKASVIAKHPVRKQSRSTFSYDIRYLRRGETMILSAIDMNGARYCQNIVFKPQYQSQM